MSELEGGAPRAPDRPILAYLEGETDGGFAERDGVPVRQDTADGDVIETTFSTDLLTLQQQLEEKARAAERAIRASLELRNELNAARAEAATLKDAVRSLRKADTGPPAADAPPPEARLVGDAFAELAKVRTESFKARKELERERHEHRAEMIQARAQYNAAQEELQRLIKVRRTNNLAAQAAKKPATEATLPRPAPPPPQPSIREWKKPLLTACFVAVSACGALAWRRAPFPVLETRTRDNETRAPDPPEVRPPGPKLAKPTADDIRAALTPAGRAQFQGAVGRLSRSLAGHSGMAPQEILREVHERYKDTDPNICAFDWRNGQPSLLYSGGSLTISQTLQRCADAVERSRGSSP